MCPPSGLQPKGLSCQRAALRLRGHSAGAAVTNTTVPITSQQRQPMLALRRGPSTPPVRAATACSAASASASASARSLRTSAVTGSRNITAAAAAGSPVGAPSDCDRSVVDVLRERGLLDACTNEAELRQAAADGSLTAYCGFDPTADSLHLGNMLGIVVLAWFQRCGHTPLALLGGATGRVGDPSGKSAERPVLDEDTINANTAGIQKILESVLANSAAMAGADVPTAKVLNNLDWFGSMGFLQFLREVGLPNP